jgi:hypothetical protein
MPVRFADVLVDLERRRPAPARTFWDLYGRVACPFRGCFGRGGRSNNICAAPKAPRSGGSSAISPAIYAILPVQQRIRSSALRGSLGSVWRACAPSRPSPPRAACQRCTRQGQTPPCASNEHYWAAALHAVAGLSSIPTRMYAIWCAPSYAAYHARAVAQLAAHSYTAEQCITPTSFGPDSAQLRDKPEGTSPTTFDRSCITSTLRTDC